MCIIPYDVIPGFYFDKYADFDKYAVLHRTMPYMYGIIQDSAKNETPYCVGHVYVARRLFLLKIVML